VYTYIYIYISEGNDETFSFGRIKMAGEDIVGGGRDKGKKYREQVNSAFDRASSYQCMRP
jgi:hypothetical protein